MKRAEIRKCFTEYVKKENLQNGQYVCNLKRVSMRFLTNTFFRMFNLDPTLANIFKTPESVMSMKMEDGINKFIGKMTLMREITMGSSKILHSGKLEPIDISVVSRMGNKKVNEREKESHSISIEIN